MPKTKKRKRRQSGGKFVSDKDSNKIDGFIDKPSVESDLNIIRMANNLGVGPGSNKPPTDGSRATYFQDLQTRERYRQMIKEEEDLKHAARNGNKEAQNRLEALGINWKETSGGKKSRKKRHKGTGRKRTKRRRRRRTKKH